MTYQAWIIYNGFLQSDKFKDFADMFYKAAKELGHEAAIYTNDALQMVLGNKVTLHTKGALPDYVIFTDKDIYLAKQLELLGVPVFNSAKTIEVSDDKIKTYQLLAEQGIPIPKTVVAPKTFGLPLALDDRFIKDTIKLLGFPLVMKETFGSFGEQVYLVDNEAALDAQIKAIGGKPFMFQQFIDTSYGVDLRLQVVGGKVVTAMKRISKNDFRANVTSGGRMEPHEASEEEKAVAIQASQAIGADFSGVDLLFGENGQAIVCEVNSNAHIRNIFDCTGVDAAYDIIRYIEERLGAEEV